MRSRVNSSGAGAVPLWGPPGRRRSTRKAGCREGELGVYSSYLSAIGGGQIDRFLEVL